MKTPEELNDIKADVETMNKKLAELNEEDLAQVSGGIHNRDHTPFYPGEWVDAEVFHDGEMHWGFQVAEVNGSFLKLLEYQPKDEQHPNRFNCTITEYTVGAVWCWHVDKPFWW